MGTQGLLTLVRKGEVVRKIVVGCNGMNIPALAKTLRKNKTDDANKLLKMAQKAEVGCETCIVIQVTSTSFIMPDGYTFEQDAEDFERWRDTFGKPRFNPRWENGTAPYVEIVEID